jgi:glutamate racemase
VEEGWVDHPVTEQVARIYLNEAFADGFDSADVLVLGCTHYPLLKPLLHRVLPQQVKLVDSAESIALTVLSFIVSGTAYVDPAQRALPASAVDTGRVRFFVTDSIEKFRRFGKLFLGGSISDITHVDLKE